MDQPTARFAIKTLLTEIREQLDEASSVAKAAEACADAGNIDPGVKVALDIEPPVYEAGRLLDVASLINRLSKEE
jgi:hypothetical protein